MRNKYDEKKQMKKCPSDWTGGKVRDRLDRSYCNGDHIDTGPESLFILDRLRGLCQPLDLESFRGFQKCGQLVLQIHSSGESGFSCGCILSLPAQHSPLRHTWTQGSRSNATIFYSNYWKHMKSYSTLTTWKGTSLRMMMGCLAGFSSSRALK